MAKKKQITAQLQDREMDGTLNMMLQTLKRQQKQIDEFIKSTSGNVDQIQEKIDFSEQVFGQFD